MSANCKVKARLDTLQEVLDKFNSSDTYEEIFFCQHGPFHRWLQSNIVMSTIELAQQSPQDKCNCDIGCGDHHAAQCAVWIEPAAVDDAHDKARKARRAADERELEAHSEIRGR